MAASVVVPRTHAPSVSLPSRPHLLASKFDECLEKLRAPEVVCSSYAISDKLHGLLDLHECIGQLLELQSTLQVILNECERERVCQVMDRSLRLLDECGIAKDILLQTKESVNALQSVLRRKRGQTAETASEISKYMTSRRNMKKLFQKHLKNLMNRNSEKDYENITVAKILLVVEQATLKVFKSLLSFISGSSGHPKDSKWCFISKLMMPSKPVVGMEDVGDFATVDATLLSYTTYDFTYMEAQNLQYKL